MQATITTFDNTAEGWERSLYAFLAEKERRSGSRRTVEGYSRMLQHFFATVGKPPDRVTSAEVFAWGYGVGISGKQPSSVTIGAPCPRTRSESRSPIATHDSRPIIHPGGMMLQRSFHGEDRSPWLGVPGATPCSFNNMRRARYGPGARERRLRQLSRAEDDSRPTSCDGDTTPITDIVTIAGRAAPAWGPGRHRGRVQSHRG